MIKIDYANEELKIFIETGNGNDKFYKRLRSNKAFMNNLSSAMNTLRIIDNIKDLDKHKRFNYECLHGNYNGMHSIRIGYNTKYRMIFDEFDGGIRICIIEISEHYGDK